MPERITGFLVLLRTGTWISFPVKVTSNFAIKKIDLTLPVGKEQNHKEKQAQVPTRVFPVRHKKIFSPCGQFNTGKGFPKGL